MESAAQKSALVVPDSARERLPAVSHDASSLMKIIDRAAMDPAFDVAKLEQLLKVKQQWEENEARKAFVAAMAAFKADPPTILKSKHVDIQGGAKFSHATLASVCDGVIASLSQHGLSHKWEIEQKDKLITVTCILTHALGHQERTTLSGAPDDSGRKNAIQQVGSTVTYLERYTLMAAVGLAAKDMDNDGGGAGGKRLDEGAAADHIAAIDAAADDQELLAVYGKAHKAAIDAEDMKALRTFTQHKDARKKAIGKKP